MVGRVPIYLLDTNLELNHPDDRGLMNKLYAGGPDLRVRQEWILGVGGVRVLRALGMDPAVWHANEGHAAFMMIERLRELIAAGTPLDQAVRQVRAHSVFTTHTPVPAGHDAFAVELLEACAGPIWEEMGIDRETLFQLGKHPAIDDQFHMTVCAMRMSARVNGVSRRHGQVSRNLWRDLWPGRPWETVPVGHVTNGVHLATWMASPIMQLLDEHIGPDWGNRLDEPGFWDRVLTLDQHRFWAAHLRLKQVLATRIREDARRRFAARFKEAAQVVGAGTLLDPNALTLGFARRFATYKRANLIFRDLDRLRRLLVDHAASGADHLRGQGPPGRQPGKGSAPERLPVHPRSRVRGPGGVPRRLRHAPRAPAGPGRGSLDQPAAGAAGGVRHERHEGGAQRRARSSARSTAGGRRDSTG